jgi:16S rRNA (cytosine967-C5)-methyltransferase
VQGDLLDDGHVAVQDESAGLIVRLLDPQPGETILDGCAAPGGKTMAIAARMDGDGTIYAVDAKEERVGLIEEAAAAQGADALVAPEAAELQSVADRVDPPRADRVLLDVPCSGLGVLSKRADLRWQRAPEDLDELAALQDELLDAAARLVRPGGLLVYSTCTIEPEENEERIEAFLARHDDFALESADGYVPDDMVTAEGYFASLPHRHRIDGAFGARLRHGSS